MDDALLFEPTTLMASTSFIPAEVAEVEVAAAAEVEA
jgi:hypothetical protein